MMFEFYYLRRCALLFLFTFCALFVYAQQNIPSYVPSSGLVGWWPFTGNAIDSSGNGNNGTVNGAVLAADRFGNINRAYNFDGTSSFISVSNNQTINFQSGNQFTFSYWINAASLSSNQISLILSKQTSFGSSQVGYNSNIESSLSSNFRIQNGSSSLAYSLSTATSSISINTWYHIVQVWSSTQGQIYLNGSLILQTSGNATVGNNSADLLIGKPNWIASNAKNFNGKIDDIGIWNRALNQCEIQALYSGTLVAGSSSAPTSPVVSNVSYCQNASAVALSASVDSSNTLVWYNSASGGSGTNVAPIPSTSTVGTVTYYVSQKNACGVEGPRAALTVTINPLATPPTTTSVSYCQNATATSLTATTLLGASPKWYTVATAGTGTLTAPIPSTSILGNTTYYVSAVSNFGCESATRTSLVVSINPNPSAPTTAPVTYCQNASTLALTAGASAGNTLKWYTVPTAGIGSVIAPAPSTATVGMFNYYVSQINSFGCESARTPLSVTTLALPSSPSVANSNYCLGAVASPLSAIGTALKWYTFPVGGTGSSVAPTPSTNSVGSLNYYVTQTDVNSCESNRALLTVFINPLPNKPTVTNVLYCQNANTSALSASPDLGNSLQWYTTSSGGVGSASAPTPSSSSTGTTNYYVSQIDINNCESFREVLSATIVANPSAPIVSNAVYCVNASASPLSATASSGNSLQWYTNSNGTGNASAATPIPSTINSGTFNFYVRQVSFNNCQSPIATINVLVNPNPAPPSVSNITYCKDAATIPLTAAALANHSLRWYTQAIGGTYSTTAPTPSSAAVGQQNFYVAQVNASACESARSLLTVTINPIPAAPITTDVSYCIGSTSATALTVANPLNQVINWYTQAVGGSSSAQAPIPSTLSAGITSYYVSYTSSNGCESARSIINASIVNLPSGPVVANATISYCQNAIASSLVATALPNHTLRWYTVATGGVASLNAITPNTSSIGTTNYYVSQVNSIGCEGSRTIISVSVIGTPVAPTVSPVVYCQNAITSALTATALPNFNLNWYSSLTSTPALSAAPIPSSLNAGITTYYVSQIGSNGCESVRQPIMVTINPKPSAPTTAPVVYCQNAAPSPLTAMPTGSNALTWYLSNSAQIGSASPFTPSTTVVGSTTYYVSQTTNLGCESSMASLVVTINPTPIAPTTSSVVYCQNSSAVAISAQALAGHTIKWYNQLLGGTLYSTTPIPSTATVGIQQYFAAQISSLGCEGSRTLMTVTINPTPSAPLVNPISYCQFDNALSLQSTITVGNAQLWYTQAVGGVGVITAPIPSTSVAGTFNFYNTQTNSFGCESPRAQLIVSVNPKPSVPITSNATYCQMQTPASILSLVQASGSLKWYSSLSATSGTSTTPLINTSISGTVNYYVTQTSSFGCESDKSIITITINPKPIKPSFTNNYVYCQGQTPIAIAATASPAHTLNWYTSINGTASSITPSINTAIANTTKYYISQVNSIGCESYKDSILITINPMPTAPSVSNNAYCQFYLATPLTASLAPNCAALWYAAQTGGSPLSSAPIPNTNILGNQSFYVSQISTAGCEGPRAVITTSIVAVPNPLIVSNLTYCQYDTAVQLQASLNGSGLSIRWYNNAIGGTYTTIAPTPNTNIPGIQNYYPCQVNSVGCESQRANLAVTINYRPLVPGVVPVVYCQGDTALALTASSCSNCTLYWWDNLTIASPYVTTPIPSTANAGTKTYYVNQISPQGCVGPKTSLLVTVNPTPLAPIVTNPSICQQNNSTLVSPYVALSANCTYGWYTAAIGGAYSMNVPSVSLVSVGTFVNYVSQINNFGCEGPRDLQAITVLPTPLAPNLSNVNYCQGTSVPSLIFTAGPGNYLTWYTSPNGGNGNTQTPSLNTNIPGISTYYVSQSTTMGCESQRDTVLFQVAPTPPIPVIANSTYCQGATASPLTATAQIGCSLRWYANASGGTPQSATPIPSTINNGTFYFYVSQINAAGCESQRAQIIVTVNPTPMAPITNNYVFCQYDQVTPLTAIGTSGATILWYTQVNGTGSTVVPSYTSTMPNTFNFYVSQISPLGCESAKSLSSVIIHPKPSMPIVANLIYCQGDTIPPLNVQGSSMSNVIKWYASASSILFNTNTLVLSSAIAGTTTYFVSQTSVQGCESDRATFTVSINPKPVLSITQASPISLCAGQSALLTTTTTIGPLTYNWYQSTSGVLGVTTSSYSVNTAGTFFVVGTTTNGCKDTSQLINVSVNPLPSGSIIAKDPIRFCYGKKATLSIVNPNLNFTYQWLYNGLPLSGATDTVYDATNPGLYSVSIKNAFNCIKISNSVLIIVDTLPTVSINLPGSVDACEGTELQLVTNLNPNLSYQWLKNTVLINGAVNNVLNVNTSGNYQVEVVNSYGCKNTSNTTTVTYYPYPSITITKDTFLMPGTFFTLMPSISNYTQLTWQPNTVNLSCFNCLNPAFTVFEPTMLYVVATNTGGCSSVDSIRIRTGCDLSLLFIPNTFTPNGDANNDRFFVSGKGIREVRNIVIYNRWGIKVFENSNFQVNDPLSGWDGNFNGTPLTSDVFTYYVEAICTNGDKISKFGDISLIR